MDILDYIPFGTGVTPITREALVKLTGLDDRMVRRLIEKAKKEEIPIINLGEGYYIADDPDDPELEAYIRTEKHRAREIHRGLKGHVKLHRMNKDQETLNI